MTTRSRSDASYPVPTVPMPLRVRVDHEGTTTRFRPAVITWLLVIVGLSVLGPVGVFAWLFATGAIEPDPLVLAIPILVLLSLPPVLWIVFRPAVDTLRRGAWLTIDSRRGHAVIRDPEGAGTLQVSLDEIAGLIRLETQVERRTSDHGRTHAYMVPAIAYSLELTADGEGPLPLFALENRNGGDRVAYEFDRLADELGWQVRDAIERD